MTRPLRIGALISGGGTNLQAIIDACESGRIDGRIVFVGADTPAARGLERADRHGIPRFVVDYREISRARRQGGDISPPPDFDLDAVTRKQHLLPADTDPKRLRDFLTHRAVAEARLLDAMNDHPFDLLVLAGFMRTFTPYFIDRVDTDPALPRIMNIHPALLPSFPGVDGYGDTFRYGCKLGGCTVHFIDYGEDSGPIIGQRAFPIREGDSLDDIRARGLRLEWELYPECIQLFAEGRLRVSVETFPLGDGRTRERRIVHIAPPAAD